MGCFCYLLGRISFVYDQVLQSSGGPYASTSQSQEPRDKKQLYNQLHQLKDKLEKSNTNTNKEKPDEFLAMVNEMKNNKMIQSIIVKESAYFYFMCSSRQIEDIIKFCCSDKDSCVFSVDTTFNLCDLWVTDSSYRNKRIISNSTGDSPVFLGPLLFHFTKDEPTFNRFMLEMVAMDPAIMKMKKLGVDMEDAIFNGIKSIIPDITHLYCVRHLRQRDEKKIDDLLAKTKSSSAEKNKAKSNILKDVYGDRNGTSLEYGLAEAKDMEDFNVKLVSLKERWESLCPNFYDWFLKRRKEKFENNVICSAREGTNVTGMYYQNDVESLHYIEKRNQCFQKKSVTEVSQTLRDLALRQENDEIRALYGAGNYRLANAYSKFQVDSARWHEWGETRRRDHVKKFRSYDPTFTDNFSKPINVGRKPSFQQRQRKEQPNVISDRIDELTPPFPSAVPEESSRFQDPREAEQEKKFELHFRKDLPRLVKKCQGLCGKVIKPDDDDMLVRSYGTSTWTDRKTGSERSKYGPMYVHFNQKCLEMFDTANHYGPGNSFDFGRIEVDKTTKDKLNNAERALLDQLGVTFL